MAPRVESEKRVLAKLRDLCLSFPETHETMTWGHPNFRAGKKIFAAFHDDGSSPCIWLKPEPPTRELLRDDPRFSPSRHGRSLWVGLQVNRPVDWALVRELLVQPWNMIASDGASQRNNSDVG